MERVVICAPGSALRIQPRLSRATEVCMFGTKCGAGWQAMHSCMASSWLAVIAMARSPVTGCFMLHRPAVLSAGETYVRRAASNLCTAPMRTLDHPYTDIQPICGLIHRHA